MGSAVQDVASQNERMIDLLKLDVRMYLMFGLLLIALIGLVLIVFAVRGARRLRRENVRSSRRPMSDDWAEKPLVPPDSDSRD